MKSVMGKKIETDCVHEVSEEELFASMPNPGNSSGRRT